MVALEVAVIEPVERIEWRCECVVRPLLALYTHLGGVHVRIVGRHHRELHYVYDLTGANLKAHCPVCHAWRELIYDAKAEIVRERQCTGPVPEHLCHTCTAR